MATDTSNVSQVQVGHVPLTISVFISIFLRQIVPGGANRSYGIHVARLAGLPQTVVSSALGYLTELEKESNPINMNAAQLPDFNLQLPLLKPSHKTVQELAKIDIESLTPLQAITKLFELKEMSESEWNVSEENTYRLCFSLLP